jgi:hypothetical protein
MRNTVWAVIVMSCLVAGGLSGQAQPRPERGGAATRPSAADSDFEYDSPEQLWKACDGLLRKLSRYEVPEDSDGQPAMRYLSHPDARMSSAAAEILMRSELNISSLGFREYLAPEYPIHVRMMALHRTFLVNVTKTEYEAGVRPEKVRKQLSGTWNEQFVQLMAMPVTPLWFETIIMDYGHILTYSPDDFKLSAIPAKAGRDGLRRCLQVLSRAVEPGHEVLWGVLGQGFDQVAVVEEVIAWYPAALTPEARVSGLMVAKRAVDKSPECRKHVLRLAKQADGDWSAEVRKTGTRIVAELAAESNR